MKRVLESTGLREGLVFVAYLGVSSLIAAMIVYLISFLLGLDKSLNFILNIHKYESYLLYLYGALHMLLLFGLISLKSKGGKE